MNEPDIWSATTNGPETRRTLPNGAAAFFAAVAADAGADAGADGGFLFADEAIGCSNKYNEND